MWMVLENQQTELGGFTLYKFKAPGGHTQTSLASINKIFTPKIVINEKVTSLKLPESLQKVVPSSRTVVYESHALIGYIYTNLP